MTLYSLLTRLKNAGQIYQKYAIKHVFLVGSYARSTENTESDVDIYIPDMIIGDIYTYMNCKFDLEAYLGKNVDLITDDNIRSGIREYLLDGAIAIR